MARQLLRKNPHPLVLRDDGDSIFVHFVGDIFGGSVASDIDTSETPGQLMAASDAPRQDDGRYQWLFRGAIYETTEVLSALEVKALALQDENKVRAKVAAAMALMDHVEQLSEHGKREPIPDDVKMFVWQRDKGACIRCGSRMLLEFDHIIPLSMGGSNTARNLQLLCENCNRSKGGNLV